MAVCSASEAKELLSERPKQYSSVYGTLRTPPESHVIEYVLYRRNKPELDLILAANARSKTVLERVYERANHATKVVCCSNSSFFTGDRFSRESILERRRISFFKKILKYGSKAELKAICQLPDLNSEMYLLMIESWARHPNTRSSDEERILDERFLSILQFLWKNERIGVAYENSHMNTYMDGYNEYKYKEFERLIWKVAELAPTEKIWAHYLARLFAKLEPALNCFDDVEAVLARWRPGTADRYDAFSELRTTIAEKFIQPSLETLNHSDPAIRDAFYSSFDPAQREFKGLDWREWIAKDEMAHLCLLQNRRIWRSASARERLSRLLWDMSEAKGRDLIDVGRFRELEEKYARKHPEWFQGERQGHGLPPLPDSGDDAMQAILNEVSSQRQGLGQLEKQLQQILVMIFVVALVIGLTQIF